MTDYNLVQYIDVDVTVPTNVKIRKAMFIDGEWQVVNFIQVDHTSKLKDWLLGNYPESGYLKNWWKTGNRVTMSDKIYLHWKLVE